VTSIGGTLDTAALSRLHFHRLSQGEQAAAIRRLAAAGQGAHTIAHATGLSVEQVRRVLRGEVRHGV
jgi:DNA invertase Pin-like site-specific DNA recombinase